MCALMRRTDETPAKVRTFVTVDAIFVYGSHRESARQSSHDYRVRR
jgi:hypothetical protein